MCDSRSYTTRLSDGRFVSQVIIAAPLEITITFSLNIVSGCEIGQPPPPPPQLLVHTGGGGGGGGGESMTLTVRVTSSAARFAVSVAL